MDKQIDDLAEQVVAEYHFTPDMLKYIDEFAEKHGVFGEDGKEAVRAGAMARLNEVLNEEAATKQVDKELPIVNKNRDIIIEIAKLWKGHEGVNYETTSTYNLLTLIQDAVIYDHDYLMKETK